MGLAPDSELAAARAGSNEYSPRPTLVASFTRALARALSPEALSLSAPSLDLQALGEPDEMVRSLARSPAQIAQIARIESNRTLSIGSFSGPACVWSSFRLLLMALSQCCWLASSARRPPGPAPASDCLAFVQLGGWLGSGFGAWVRGFGGFR